jgi:signal transduction histidine kinase
VRRTSGAGLPVSLESSLAGPLPAGVERAAYRIVQESLTNALRHAGPATASVRLDRADDELVVEVVDTGRGGGGAVGGGTGDGLGITGMRARAEALGGALDAGPGPDGGFVVRARLPVRSRP